MAETFFATLKKELVLRLEALERRLGVDERAVHAEVFQAHQPGLLRLRYHLAEEAWATSSCINRARFLEKVLWSKWKSRW